MPPPSFLCIGAAKAGTTSLYHLLKQHPAVQVSTLKEPHFFNDDQRFAKGLDWYRTTYFTTPATTCQASGEFTPDYLADPRVAARVHAMLGAEVRLIVLFRHPVDRAFSHYLHLRRDGMTEQPFSAQLQQEHTTALTQPAIPSYCYRNSLYGDNIQRWLHYFDREQILPLWFEDFFQHPAQNLHRICRFLDVAPYDFQHQVHKNAARAVPRILLPVKRLINGNGRGKRWLKRHLPAKTAQHMRLLLNSAMKIKKTDTHLAAKDKQVLFDRFFRADCAQLQQQLRITVPYL